MRKSSVQPAFNRAEGQASPSPSDALRIHFSSRAAGEEGELLGIQTPRLG